MTFDYQKVRLIAITKPEAPEFPEDADANDLISYCARVSNPANQNNFDTQDKLLKYCIRKKHWSIFEMADFVLELETTRDISHQILRHGFRFQEFSQRYADPTKELHFIDNREARFQDPKNRQNSIPLDDLKIQFEWEDKQRSILAEALEAYDWAIDQNIAKECARVVLPEGLTMSRMYVKGSVRQWYHYTLVRMAEDTQAEHRDIAQKVHEILIKKFPFIKDIEMES